MFPEMIIISILAGLLSTMNVLVINNHHMRVHLNDIYMISLMTSWMVLIYSIYYEKILISIIGLFFVLLFLYLLKTQTLINDKQFVKGMIPHHSMAILMSKKIKEKTKNKDISQLADNIIKTQISEINTLEAIERNL